jgi:hypothetical protein
MQSIKPNNKEEAKHSVKIFLAGSIEMGTANDWQAHCEHQLREINVTIFNPRRDDWDSTWTQEQTNPQFNYQVNWEMNNLEIADIVFFYFDPNTKSPISMMELGAFGHKNAIVCCPEGFWRKGNIDIFCTRNNIPLFEDLDRAIGALVTKITQLKR